MVQSPCSLPPPTTDLTTPNKPLKRPSQARAKFTVQAMYDAFAKIWREKGWEGITTRAVALETGVAVGTLYDYFPNKQSLLSGYVRYCMDTLLDAIEQQVIQPPELTWRERVQRLVRLTCAIDHPALPYFDTAMLLQEAQIAEPKHHRRVYEELSAKWLQAIQACTDLNPQPDAATVRALYVSAWGGKRYLLLIGRDDPDSESWVLHMERLCCLALHPGA